MFKLFVLLIALALAVPAQAQQTRSSAGLSPRGQLTLTVPSGSSSAATALPLPAAGGSVLFLHNNGAYPIRFNLGGGTVQASATTSYLMTAGECTAYALSDGQTYIAAWGIGGASSLEVTQGNGLPAVNCANIATGTITIATVNQGTSPWVASADVCSSTAKSSVPINVTSATTTSLVAVSGTKAVYVCGFSLTIAPSLTSAATALFEYGTGASCTGTHALTGILGGGYVAAAANLPIPVSYGDGNATIFGAPASNGVCIVTAGTAVSVQGVLTFVQQ